MPYRYLPEFRCRVLDLLAAGRSVASLSADLGVSGADNLQVATRGRDRPGHRTGPDVFGEWRTASRPREDHRAGGQSWP